MIFFLAAFFTYKPPTQTDNAVTFDKRDSAKRQMSFVNGSFRESEYEGSVLDGSNHPVAQEDKMTNL